MRRNIECTHCGMTFWGYVNMADVGDFYPISGDDCPDVLCGGRIRRISPHEPESPVKAGCRGDGIVLGVLFMVAILVVTLIPGWAWFWALLKLGGNL